MILFPALTWLPFAKRDQDPPNNLCNLSRAIDCDLSVREVVYVILIWTMEAKKLIEVNKIELLFGKHNNIFLVKVWNDYVFHRIYNSLDEKI